MRHGTVQIYLAKSVGSIRSIPIVQPKREGFADDFLQIAATVVAMTQPHVDVRSRPASATGVPSAGQSAGNGGQPVDGFRLFLDLQRVVEFVEEAAERD